MHDLNLNLFYKTSFDISAIDTDGDALWAVICDIRRWMTTKWARNGIEIPSDNSTWSAFKRHNKFGSEGESKSVYFDSSIYYGESGGVYWACKIQERMTEEDTAPREWVTEMGFSYKGYDLARGTLSIVLSYGDAPGFLGPRQETPGLSIPKIVWMLLDDDQIKCSVDGRVLSRRPIELHLGDFPDFWEVVSDDHREQPVIYVSPRFRDGTSSLAVDPDAVANALGPSALVYYTDDTDFCKEMAYLLRNPELRCSNGTVRIYAARPRVNDPTDQYRHRFFPYDTICTMGVDAFVGMLRRALAQDVNFYEQMVRVDGVREKVRRATRIKRMQGEQDEVLGELADEMEQRLRDKEAENDQLSSERDRLRAENVTLTSKVAGLSDALNRKRPDSFGDIELEKWPLNPQSMVHLFRDVYPDRIDITERCEKSLDECTTKPELLWNAMADLCKVLWPLLTREDNMDIAHEFNERSNFSYARDAGSMTRKDNGLMQNYFDVYRGAKINVEQHIKKGSNESKDNFLRIYFCFHQKSKKIILSHVGKHLDNYMTRSIH